MQLSEFQRSLLLYTGILTTISTATILLLNVITIIQPENDTEKLLRNYEQCCLEEIYEYIQYNNSPPSLITLALNFSQCKSEQQRAMEMKMTIYGITESDFTLSEVYEYVLQFWPIYVVVQYLMLVLSYFKNVGYILSTLEVCLAHYFVVLRSIPEGVELIYYYGFFEYFKHTPIVAKNVELFGMLFIYRILSQIVYVAHIVLSGCLQLCTFGANICRYYSLPSTIIPRMLLENKPSMNIIEPKTEIDSCELAQEQEQNIRPRRRRRN